MDKMRMRCDGYDGCDGTRVAGQQWPGRTSPTRGTNIVPHQAEERTSPNLFPHFDNNFLVCRDSRNLY